jgi:hypothetical protein
MRLSIGLAVVLLLAAPSWAGERRVRITRTDGTTVEGVLEERKERVYRLTADGKLVAIAEGDVARVEFLDEAPAKVLPFRDVKAGDWWSYELVVGAFERGPGGGAAEFETWFPRKVSDGDSLSLALANGDQHDARKTDEPRTWLASQLEEEHLALASTTVGNESRSVAGRTFDCQKLTATALDAEKAKVTYIYWFAKDGSVPIVAFSVTRGGATTTWELRGHGNGDKTAWGKTEPQLAGQTLEAVLAARVKAIFARLAQLLQETRLDEIAPILGKLEDLMIRNGKAGTDAVERALAGWKDVDEWRVVGLEIRRRLDTRQGEDHIAAMRKAQESGALDDVLREEGELEKLVEAMRRVGRLQAYGEFTTKADAFQSEGKRIVGEARRAKEPPPAPPVTLRDLWGSLGVGTVIELESVIQANAEGPQPRRTTKEVITITGKTDATFTLEVVQTETDDGGKPSTKTEVQEHRFDEEKTLVWSDNRTVVTSERIEVPAGTFDCTRYSTTLEGGSDDVWIARGVPVEVKAVWKAGSLSTKRLIRFEKK